MKEFIVNEFLKLKLENKKTLIYVNNKRVLQCKYLLLNPIEMDGSNKNENSLTITLDEQIETLDRSLERDDLCKIEVPPETEFWAHCSNLQAWYENSYDTQVLHSNLAFPLLKKLTHAGDSLASLVFKKEITKRFRSGNLNVMVFLIKGGYLDHLNIEEWENLYEELSFEKYKELQKLLREASKTLEGFII
ncbi:MAG: hypothetical protein ACTSR8_20555 [Promethearchaeota archaeon]